MYLKICLSFRLEGDNHETDEDVDHEEGEDDDVDEVEHEDDRSIAFFGTDISFVGVDRDVENPEKGLKGLKQAKKDANPGHPSNVDATKRVSMPRMTLS